MPPPSDPTEIGRYRIDSVIGRGAMGVIYRAHDPVIDRPVALKLIRAELLEGEERTEFVTRFQREVRAAARCAHTNIVAIYDFAVHQGNPFIAMEYIEGRSLAQMLQREGRLPHDRAAGIVRQVLDALAGAHRQGIVHRDIKPANILLTAEDVVKVTDFGISRVSTSTLTQSGAMVGTPSYMSPEQFRGSEIDLRSDLFSAGVLLYELLTGERPFPGRNLEEIAHRVFHERPLPLAGKAPRAPSGLTAFFETALAKQPEQRFGSATVMIRALDAALLTPPPPSSETDETNPAPVAATAELDTARIESLLAEHVGPIARVLMREALGKSPSLEELCRSLSDKIPNDEARTRFLRQALALPSRTAPGRPGAAEVQTIIRASASGSAPAPAATSLSETEIEHAQRELARFLGPIAKVLVKRALASASTPQQLWAALAPHIDRPADREAFLRTRPGA